MASMWLTRSKWQRTTHSIMVRIVYILYLHFDVARGLVIVDMVYESIHLSVVEVCTNWEYP